MDFPPPYSFGNVFLISLDLGLRVITIMGFNTHHHQGTFLRVLGFVGG